MDLGINTPANTIVQAIKKYGIGVVEMSPLLATTIARVALLLRRDSRKTGVQQRLCTRCSYGGGVSMEPSYRLDWSVLRRM
jgi:hypothetical protein